jgi:formyltetrahydrofolate deformylase
MARYILTLFCQDVKGIVAAVSGFLAQYDGFILESTQFGDPDTKQFFMRVDFAAGDKTPDHETLRVYFAETIGTPFSMQWQLHDALRKQRVVLLVSKEGHCLNDLMHRYRTGQLPIEIPAVISNHDTMRSIVEWHGIAYHHLPITPETKPQQEAQLWQVIEEVDADVVVLARYMQILSPELSGKLEGRAINIHHSFLPSFKGAKPYHQAYERGVKIIGATAHYVTDALDEGPIIEQEIARVTHANSPDALAAIGRDTECLVLARALAYHIEHRVLMNGNKTVVFK